MQVSQTIGDLMRNGKLTNNTKLVFWEDRRTLAQRIKYLSALEEMLNFHLWEMGKLTKEQFIGVVRNVIN